MRAHKVKREAGCYVGAFDLPGGITVSGRAEDALSALERTAAMAERLANDPLVQAIMPPQVAASLNTVRAAVKAIKSGDAEAFVKKVGPQVAKRAISFLKKVL